MSAAAVVVIINRPRPPNAPAGGALPTQVSVLYDPTDSDSEILRKAADQLDAGVTIPGGS